MKDMNVLKKLLCLLLVFSVICGFPSYSAQVSASESILYEDKFGDVNSDGTINSSDARILLRCSVGLEEITGYILQYGDYTLDGEITSEDARIALRTAVGLENVRCILEGHRVVGLTVKAGCTSDGYSVEKCSRCSYTEGEKYNIVKAPGHSFSESTGKADCTSDGLYIRKCTVCSYVAEKRVAEKAKGHSFGIWQIDGKVKERICKDCNYKETSDKTKTVYLTFDDGPGPYTERLLEILRSYGVKATFFVTNQMPKYRYLLKEIVNDGHAIGVHTLTHQWSIYSGRESYLRDFQTMHGIILEDTGVDTRIFRFPGGTNNTVSRSYSRGIMSSMAAYMTQQGYTYYDWNVDCGDTLGYSASGIANSVISGIKNKSFSIVLMHDIKYNTVEAMPAIIEYCLANGYELAVIDESTPRIQFSAVN